jgi:hypothetical protein
VHRSEGASQQAHCGGPQHHGFREIDKLFAITITAIGCRSNTL